MHSFAGCSGQGRALRHPRDVPGGCSYALRPQLSSRLLARQRRRAVLVNAAAKSLYEVLGVPESANEREIKRAYRQKALKLHPDVNKAPNAEAQFLEVKNAFTVLSDPKQRSDYDRKMRGGFGGSWGSGGGYDFGSWGSTTGAGTTGSRPRPKQQEEEFYGLGDLLNEVGSGVGQWVQQQAEELGKLQQGATDLLGGVVQKAGDSIKSGKLEDFFNDLEKEVNAWSKQRAESGKPASLWEELSAIGEEFVDFLESGLGDEYKKGSSAAASSSSSSASASGGKDGSSSGSRSEFNRSSGARSPMDKYEELKRRYDLYDEELKRSNSGSSKSSSNGTGGASRATAGSTSSSRPSSSTSGSSQAKTPPKTRDEEVDDELAALKKKLGKL